LSFVPDDSLHGFPFAALMQGDKYLVERYAVSVALEREPQRPVLNRPLAGPAEALLVGMSRGNSRFAPLLGTPRELDGVERWLRDARVGVKRLMDEQADRETVRSALARAAFAHLACHGVFCRDDAGGTGLVLLSDPDSEKEEILSFQDLAHLDLGGLRHVTLTACWSADNFVLPGRWVVSLPETLCRAGVRSVLGSLWQVDDNLAIAFVRRFYLRLATLPR